MAEQITITIPDALSKRLKAVREDIRNVSAIAAECIEHAVILAELKKTNIEHAKKLRKQKEIYDKKYRKWGEEEAVRDFKNYTYAALAELVRDGWKSNVYEEARLVTKANNNDDPVFNLGEYMTGWLSKIQSQFQEIQSDLRP
jgi:hypothetical protein